MAALQCPASQIFGLSEWLVGLGASRVAVRQNDYVFRASNALVERLERRIGPA